MNMQQLTIDGYHLTNQCVIDATRGWYERVALSPEAADRCRKTRRQIDRWLMKDAPVVYGVTTGLGSLKDRALSPEAHLSWNRTIPYPHAVGFEPGLDPDLTRAALLIRANVLARGYSAVRVELIERILDVFNAGISPVVYELGSTGLSDLSSLAQSILTVVGDEAAEAFYRGKRMNSREALRLAGLPETFSLQCKETLAQMNGSSMTQAYAVHAIHRFQKLFTLQRELDGGGPDTFWDDIDATSAYIADTINMENNVSCDNPLLFALESGDYEAVMGCNCSNTQVGYGLDLLCILICEAAMRLAPDFPGADPAVQGLLAELRGLTLPASADSISTKANQEDHVEFSFGAARKALQALDRYAQLLTWHCVENMPACGGELPAELGPLLRGSGKPEEIETAVHTFISRL